jgi:hypothetical protein
MKKEIVLTFILGLTLVISCKKTIYNQEIDQGKIENNMYTNKTIGWSIEIPENWETVDVEQLKRILNKGLEATQEVANYKVDISESKRLITFKKDKYNIFLSVAEPVGKRTKSAWRKNYARGKKLGFNTLENQGLKIDTSETKSEKIDGIDFLYYERRMFGQNDSLILTQITYSSQINGYEFGTTISSNNDIYKDVMLKSWKSSKFNN